MLNWYKISQETNISQVVNPEDVFSKNQFEDLMSRAWNLYKDFYVDDDPPTKTWKDWLNNYPSSYIRDHLESEQIFYVKYLNKLPEDISILEIIEAYKSGKLKNSTVPILKIDRMKLDIPETTEDTEETALPWQKSKFKRLNNEQLKDLYKLAIMRRTSSNSEKVDEARKTLFIIYNGDRDLHTKLEISSSELKRKIKSMSGFSASAKKIEDYLNKNIPEEYHWSGISNSTFIGRQKLSPKDLDRLVKSIDTSQSSMNNYYYGNSGEILRRHIISTFLAIDTRISYEDLSFSIESIPDKMKNGKPIPIRGEYEPENNKIKISHLYGNTIAHEIGHYLDYKFGKELLGIPNTALSEISSVHALNPHYNDWVKKYNSFIMSLSDRSDISSEYTQSFREVFARFIAKFVEWVQGKSNSYYKAEEDYRKDKFNENDFMNFIYLLQEKSFLDKKLKDKKTKTKLNI